jgi:hypothetical protein
MGALVRNRFVVLELAEDWIERARVPLWTLSAIDGTASLSFTMFPVAEGVAMNLARLRAIEHARRQTYGEVHRAAHRAGRAPAGRFFVDETSWTEEAIFCVESTHRVDFEPLGFRGLRGITREWSISDGKYVLEATLQTDTEDAFERAAPACERMLHSVRFEGPS